MESIIFISKCFILVSLDVYELVSIQLCVIVVAVINFASVSSFTHSSTITTSYSGLDFIHDGTGKPLNIFLAKLNWDLVRACKPLFLTYYGVFL